MKIEEIIKKFDGILSEEDLGKLKDQLKEMVSEQVTIRVEAETERLTKLADEFCEKQIAEGVSLAEADMAKDYEEKLDIIESSVVDKLDKYLDVEISEKISDDVLKIVAINETYAPIIEGIKHLFEDKYVDLDSEGSGLLRQSQEKIESLEEKHVELVNEKIELAESAEKATRELLVARKSMDLTESEREKLGTLTEGKDFEELHEKIDTLVEMVMESGDTVSEDSEETIEGQECLNEEKLVNESDDSEAKFKDLDYIESLL